MHLVHVRLRAAHARPLPDDTSARIMSHARPEDALEHVSVGRDWLRGQTLGLFFSSAALSDAENAALRLTLRALRSSVFEGFAVEACGAVLVPRLHPLATDAPGALSTSGQGHICPGQSPSLTGEPP